MTVILYVVIAKTRMCVTVVMVTAPMDVKKTGKDQNVMVRNQYFNDTEQLV